MMLTSEAKQVNDSSALEDMETVVLQPCMSMSNEEDHTFPFNLHLTLVRKQIKNICNNKRRNMLMLTISTITCSKS